MKYHGGWFGGTTRYHALKRAETSLKVQVVEPWKVELPMEELKRRMLTGTW